MTDPRDGQPHDQFGSPAGPSQPPTTPPSSGYDPFYPPNGEVPQPPVGPDTAASSHQPAEPEYVVHSGPHPVPPTSFQDAPDPFGGPVPPSGGEDEQKRGRKGWIIPVAAIVVLAVVAAAVYFLFFQSDDSDNSADDPPASEQTEPGRGESSPSESGSTESDSESEPADQAAITGTFAVNGTIESYTGPPTGQLGGTPKTAGSPAFTSPQTWTIEGCTDATCELTIEQSGMTLTLELADGSWVGEATQQIACTPTAGAMTDATVAIEIPEAGGTAKRTLSAQCDEPIEEVDALTLTPQ